MNEDKAETLALNALQFVLSDETLKGRFISITGLAPSDLNEAIYNKEFLGGVLDFILGNEADCWLSAESSRLIRNTLQKLGDCYLVVR